MKTVLLLLFVALLLAILCACGGGAAALPFGSPPADQTTEPVTCAPSGCTK